MGTVGISLIHSCASLIWWRGIRLPWESHSYSRRLPALVWISSLWHSGHWAEITLCQPHPIWGQRIGFPLSAPDLSWLFIALEKIREAFPVRQLSPNVNPLDTAKRQAAPEQLKSTCWGSWRLNASHYFGPWARPRTLFPHCSKVAGCYHEPFFTTT